VSSQSKVLTDWLNAELRKKFRKVKFNGQERLDFLGLEITHRDGQIDVSMDKYIAGLLKEWGGSGKDSSPAGPDLSQIRPILPVVLLYTCPWIHLSGHRDGLFPSQGSPAFLGR
jgi:hypothetical protein